MRLRRRTQSSASECEGTQDNEIEEDDEDEEVDHDEEDSDELDDEDQEECETNALGRLCKDAGLMARPRPSDAQYDEVKQKRIGQSIKKCGPPEQQSRQAANTIAPMSNMRFVRSWVSATCSGSKRTRAFTDQRRLVELANLS
jgi:hypothetical protein